MLRKLWRAEKAAWAAWRQALKPLVIVTQEPALPETVEQALLPAPVLEEVQEPAAAPQAEQVHSKPTMPALYASPSDALAGFRWTLYDAAGQPVKGLHGMTTSELDEIRFWPGPKWDALQRSWR